MSRRRFVITLTDEQVVNGPSEETSMLAIVQCDGCDWTLTKARDEMRCTQAVTGDFPADCPHGLAVEQQLMEYATSR